MPLALPKDREHDGDAAANGLGAVCCGGRGEEELLGPRSVFPAYDCGSVEQDFDGFASGEDGGDAGMRVRDVDLCLRGETGGDGVNGKGLLWAVDHVVVGGWASR